MIIYFHNNIQPSGVKTHQVSKPILDMIPRIFFFQTPKMYLLHCYYLQKTCQKIENLDKKDPASTASNTENSLYEFLVPDIVTRNYLSKLKIGRTVNFTAKNDQKFSFRCLTQYDLLVLKHKIVVLVWVCMGSIVFIIIF